MSTILVNLRPVAYDRNLYVSNPTEKRQIVVRHTGLRTGPNDRLAYLLETEKKLPASVIVAQNGEPLQCFASTYWGRHLGVKARTLAEHGFHDAGVRGDLLNQGSIAVELHSAGGLMFYRGQWYMTKVDPTCGELEPNLKRPMHREAVVKYAGGYGGFEGYERYTKAQIDTLRQLLHYWSYEHSIPARGRADAWFGSREALAGAGGVFTMLSYQPDSTLVHPQDELRELLANPQRW